MATAVESARLPLRTRAFYGVGSVSEGVKNTVFNVFLLFYYNQVLGLSGTLAGAAIFVALVFDAITDPLIGSISDNFHSRWGRRHPFMYMAAVPMAVCFILLLNPPDLEQTGLFLWLCAFAIGVRASMTLYSIPSGSMVPELTENYDERTTLVTWRLGFGWAGGLTASLLGYLYFLAPSDTFADGRLDPDAYVAFGVFCGAMIFGSILLCAFGTHHLIPSLKPPPEKTPLSLGRFVGEVRDVYGNRWYRNLVIGALFAAVAGGFNEVVGLYMNTYFWGFTTNQLATIVLALSLGVVLAVVLTRPLTERMDKRRVVLQLTTFAISFGPLPVFLRLLDLMPANGDPLLLYMILGHGILIVAAVIAITIAISSMIADSVDENELKTGKRQEGMFVAAISFTTKATSGIGSFFAGIALDLIAFPRQAELGTVPPEKIFALGLVVGPGLMIFYVLMLFFLSRYRMTREHHREILAELERRRDSQAGDDALRAARQS